MQATFVGMFVFVFGFWALRRWLRSASTDLPEPTCSFWHTGRSHHYRRIVPALLDMLSFQCNNDLHRPVMDALSLLDRYRDDKAPVFPETEKVPLDGVVRDNWQDLVLDDKHGGGINRISYEWCVLTALREKVRCKEVWVKGADRFRNPDEDLPEDFDARREEYYAAIEQPRDAKVFVETLRRNMDAALDALNLNLPSNPKVSIVTTKRGKGRISPTPLDEQPEPPNIVKLTAALVDHWPMTNLLDILKETELRVRFTDVFRTVGSREVLTADVLQRRLLLCLLPPFSLINSHPFGSARSSPGREAACGP